MTGAPLAGIRVLDLTRALAGPYCTALLADLGAVVIKAESMRGGDTTRSWPPFEGAHSLYFDSVNRGKQSIAIDFYSADGQAVLRRLADEADVVIENFRPGVMRELGLDPEDLRREHPALVVASISAFGSSGPLAAAAGLDQVAQAMSGLMSVTGDGSQPMRYGVPIIDIVSGVFCALGVVAALLGTERTGQGALVATSLLESALALSTFQGQRFLSTGEVPGASGNDHPSLTPYGVFRTADIPIVIAAGSQAQWVALCDLLGDPGLADDARYATLRLRFQHRPGLVAALESLLAARPAAEWIDRIRDRGIPCGPILSYDEVFADEQVRSLGMVDVVHRSDGSALPLLRGPISIDGSTAAIRIPPPDLGAQGADILRAAGFGDDEIGRLVEDAVISGPIAVDGARA